MKDKIKCLINRYWKFDDQTPMSNWHDKQDLLNEIEKLFESEQSEIVPIGTKVRVTKKSSRYKFLIGDVVYIYSYDDDDQTLPYLCAGEEGIYWLNRNEFEIIEP